MEPRVSVLLWDGFESSILHLTLSLNPRASRLISKYEAYAFGLVSDSCCPSLEYGPWTCGSIYQLPEDSFQPLI